MTAECRSSAECPVIEGDSLTAHEFFRTGLVGGAQSREGLPQDELVFPRETFVGLIGRADG